MSQNVFYAADRDPGERGGIYRYVFEEKNGVRLQGFSAQPYANFLLYSRDGERLYAGGEGKPDGSGFVSTFLIGPDGALRKEAEFPAAKGNCHLVQAGEFLYAANYADGSFSEFRLQNGIAVEETARIVQHGSGPVAVRQDAAHVHSCNLTPDGKYLAVIDLGSDRISCYALGKSGVSPTPERVFSAPAGSGPRHLIFAPDGRTAYVVNELANSVSSLQYENGQFTLLKTVSVLPRFFRGKAKAAAIRFDAARKYLGVTVRGFDAVAFFAPGPHGMLKRVSLALTGGAGPRDGNFLTPQCYAAACESSGEVVVFDYQEGRLTPNGIRLELQHPLYVLPGSERPKSEKLRNRAQIRLDKKPFPVYISAKDSQHNQGKAR